MSRELLEARADYPAARRAERAGALQTAALFLAAGLDLDAAVDASHAERQRIVLRLERLIERERLRGAARHWAYDLNRHIALTQVLARLKAPAGAAAQSPLRKPARHSGMSAGEVQHKRKGTPAVPRPLENR